MLCQPLLASFLMLMTIPPEPIRIYVAPTGDDQWSGTAAEKKDTEGPFQTIERAKEAIRQKKHKGLSRPIEVLLAGGTYLLTEPLTLGEADSGAPGLRITYRAVPGEKAVLTGGRELRDWKPLAAGEYDRLPAEARQQVIVCSVAEVEDLGDPTAGHGRAELFDEGVPLPLARWPNDAFVKIATLTGNNPIESHGLKGDKLGKFTIAEDRVGRWTDEPDLRVHGYWFWDWSEGYAKVTSLDTHLRELTLGGAPHHYGYRAGQRFYVLNALSELDAPGEWYLDRKQKRLLLWPATSPGSSRLVLSVLPTLIEMKDASWVTLRGLTLEASRGTAVSVAGGEAVEIIGCTIQGVGGAAITMTGSGHEVRGCDLAQIGESGISITAGDRHTLQSGNGVVENNHIHHFARWRRTYAPAIGIAGVGQRIANNLIHDAPHCAVLLSGNDHLLEENEIHHVCQETGDVGAFYMGRDWSMRGNLLRHNYFHDIQGPGLHGAMAVYLDDAASGTTIYGNVFYRAGRAAFVGGGRDNRITNNIFVECTPSVHVDARGLGWMRGHIEEDMPQKLKALPYTSPPWSARYPELLTLFDQDPGAPVGNVIERNISVGGRWSDIEKAAIPLVTFAQNLVNTDPHFVDAQSENFQIRDDSPAYKLGFQRIPFERIGLIPNADRASWAGSGR